METLDFGALGVGPERQVAPAGVANFIPRVALKRSGWGRRKSACHTGAQGERRHFFSWKPPVVVRSRVVNSFFGIPVVGGAA